MPWFVIRGEPALVGPVLAAARPYADSAELRGVLADAPTAVRAERDRLAAVPGHGLAAVAHRLRHALGGGPVLRVEPSDDTAWDLLVEAAPWAESVDVLEDAQTMAARVHDHGRTAVLRVTADEGIALADDLRGTATVEPLDDNRVWWRLATRDQQ